MKGQTNWCLGAMQCVARTVLRGATGWPGTPGYGLHRDRSDDFGFELALFLS
jgi:hypothetical protein